MNSGFFRARAFPLALMAMLLMIPLVRVLQDGGAALSMFAMILALALVGIIPGMLIAVVVGAASPSALLEAAAIGFGVTFALIQLLTVFALQLHVGALLMVTALWAGSLLLAAWFVLKPPQAKWSIGSTPGHWLILGLAAVLAVSLYAQTPFEPWMTGEDAIHVAVAQRLAFESSPSLTNIYWAPNFPYTYPFPATHYFIALVARASRLDPVFVYQKARMLWGPVTLLMLFAAGRMIFRSERIALASAIAAATLTLSGAFGPISSTWGQLAPVSHASDVAMTTLLPALLLMTMHFVAAERIRTAACFLLGTLALALTLTVVHIREVVQFLVYTIAAWAAYRWIVRDRALARRFGWVAVSTIVLTVSYLQWYKTAVGHVDEVVALRRGKLITDVTQMSLSQFVTPIWSNNYFTINHEYFFYMWFPFVLLLAPWVLYRWRSRPLVPFLSASLLAYALIVFVPLIAILYVYFTYYEILFTPVRNSLFFIYLLAGPIILTAGDALSRIVDLKKLIGTAAVVSLGLWLAFRASSQFFLHSQNPTVQNIFFLVLIGSLAFVLLRSRRSETQPAEPPGQPAGMKVFYALLAVVAVIGFSAKSSPLNFDRAAARWTMRDYLAAMPDVTGPANSTFRDPLTDRTLTLSETVRQMAPPSPELIEAGKQMPSNTVMLHNIFNTYASPVFMPQHILMWPVDSAAGLEFNARLFPTAWAALVETADRYQVQPFFNVVETVDERVEYMRKVGATHALIDPMYYDRLHPLFSAWATQFDVLFDDGRRWAVVALKPTP